MRKKLLFILVLFIAFAGSYKEEIKAASNFDAMAQQTSGKAAKPKITKKNPESGKVHGNARRTVYFFIEFEANPLDSVRVYKDGVKFTQGVTTTDRKATVTFEKAKVEDSGEYKIVVKNKLGTVEEKFTVKITK